MRAPVAAVLLVVAAGAARADETTEERASRHFVTGQKAFNDGDYQTAIDEFGQAYSLLPHPDVLIDIAVSHERMYQPDRAREKYEQFLKDAPDTADEASKRTLAKNRLRVLLSLPGKIVVEASKPHAAVHLVGEGRDVTGETPKTFDQLPPGRYKIHVELGYHTPQDVEVKLEPAGQNVVNVQLEHQVETLTVFTRPSGARVFLDDREEGVTPFSRPIDVGQKRRLRIEAEDYPAWTEEVDVVAGHPVRRDIVFRRPFRSGRSELVLGSMIFGGAGSVFITESAMGCTSSACGVSPGIRLGLDLGATVVGVGLGFLVSSLTTDDHVKVGHSSIIIGGTVWGTTLAASLGLGLRLDGQDILAVSLLGSALGISAGLITARVNDTSPGDAAIVNSGGTWGSITGLLMATAINFGDANDRTPALGWLTLSGCALGLVAGGFLAWNIEISRGHVAVVDVAGLTGLALAFAVGYGVSPTGSTRDETDHLRLVTGSRYGLGGMVVGLLAGAILSRKYKDDLPPTEALFTHHGRWAFGLPQIHVVPAPEGRDSRITFDLARGEF